MCNANSQFPQDICEAALGDHVYCISTVPQTLEEEEVQEEGGEDDMMQVTGSQGSQVDLFPSLAGKVIVEDNSNDHAVMENGETMDEVISQETTSSRSEFIPGDGARSKDELFSSQETSKKTDNTTPTERVFLVYESKLKDLLRFCPLCGALVIQDSTVEVSKEGIQLFLKLTCMGSCTYKWHSQPTLNNVKVARKLLVTAGILFSGIPFAIFESFAKIINLKFMGKGAFFNLREDYVFPVVKSAWKNQQAAVFF